MKHLTPETRAILLQQANQRAHDLTVFFFVGGLLLAALFTLIWFAVTYPQTTRRHFAKLKARAERNRARLTAQDVLARANCTATNRVLDRD